MYVFVTSGSTPVALNLNPMSAHLTNKLISPALVLPVPAPSAIPVLVPSFSVAASTNDV